MICSSFASAGSGLASGDLQVEMTFIEPARYLRWSLPSRTFLDKRLDRRVTLQNLLIRDVAGELEPALP